MSRSRSNVFKCPIDTVDHEKTFEWGGVASLIPCLPAEKVGLKAGMAQASLGQGGQSSNRQVIRNPQS